MTHVPNLIYIAFVVSISFLLMFVLSPVFLKFLKKNHINNENKTTTIDGKKAEIFMQHHAKKNGTPTMGGVLMLLVAGITTILFYFTPYNFVERGETWVLLFTFFVAGILGAIDDLLKTRPLFGIKRFSASIRLLLITLLSSIGAYWFYFKIEWSMIHIPGVGDFDIGFWYMPLFVILILIMTQAVNITDGLDGLSGGLLIYSYFVFAIIAYTAGLFNIVAFIAMIIGILVAYMWYNVNPAVYFGGDSYSYSMGATLAVVAIMTNSVIILFIVGFIFLLELASSFIQLFWKRVFKKKLIPAAPFHHTLQHIGWVESQIVMRLWIIGGMFAVIGGIIGLIGMGDMI